MDRLGPGGGEIHGVIQAWDFRPGRQLRASRCRGPWPGRSARSRSYLPTTCSPCTPWPSGPPPSPTDPDGAKGKLVPVLVREVTLEGLLATSSTSSWWARRPPAREALLKGLAPGGPAGERPVSRSAPVPARRAHRLTRQGRAPLAALPLDEVPQPGPPPGRLAHALRRQSALRGPRGGSGTLARQLKAGETSAVGQVKSPPPPVSGESERPSSPPNSSTATAATSRAASSG